MDGAQGKYGLWSYGLWVVLAAIIAVVLASVLADCVRIRGILSCVIDRSSVSLPLILVMLELGGIWVALRPPPFAIALRAVEITAFAAVAALLVASTRSASLLRQGSQGEWATVVVAVFLISWLGALIGTESIWKQSGSGEKPDWRHKLVAAAALVFTTGMFAASVEWSGSAASVGVQ